MRKKSILIAVIAVIVVIAIIATVIVIKDNKAKSAETEENIRAESETKTKTGINIEFTYYEDYWQTYDLKNAVYKTQAEYETAVRNYINQIASLLNKQDWYQQYEGIDTIFIGLKVADSDDAPNLEGITFSKNISKTIVTCDLYMNNTMFRHNRSQLIHLLTQLVTTKTTNTMTMADGRTNALEHGFYEYVQSYLGMGIGSLNYGIDVHNYLNELTKKYEQDTIKNVTMSKIRDNVGEISKYLTYHSYNEYFILSNYSFVDYMVNTYGIESVMKMMDAYDESIYYMFNQNGLSGMLSDWKLFLEKYPSKMTLDEINAQIAEIKSTHGY
ncbi:hypothetical protein [[Clostridium] fimetarium]|uniref:Uncharacterized protein n=1 Tax=[Clostridium] fimetarium TaxID=99656 RepID=A0A1I0RL72_9FIRM|nr:hypothetical protein [[Clostridium] fimetarium]SEW41861.1 hypothetical protein SAMN05421659_11832 [[Clostridium] fimetarium]